MLRAKYESSSGSGALVSMSGFEGCDQQNTLAGGGGWFDHGGFEFLRYCPGPKHERHVISSVLSLWPSFI